MYFGKIGNLEDVARKNTFLTSLKIKIEINEIEVLSYDLEYKNHQNDEYYLSVNYGCVWWMG
jgi:hypothetical protein